MSNVEYKYLYILIFYRKIHFHLWITILLSILFLLQIRNMVVFHNNFPGIPGKKYILWSPMVYSYGFVTSHLTQTTKKIDARTFFVLLLLLFFFYPSAKLVYEYQTLTKTLFNTIHITIEFLTSIYFYHWLYNIQYVAI